MTEPATPPSRKEVKRNASPSMKSTPKKERILTQVQKKTLASVAAVMGLGVCYFYTILQFF